MRILILIALGVVSLIAAGVKAQSTSTSEPEPEPEMGISDWIQKYPAYVTMVGMGIIILLMFFTTIIIICVLSGRRSEKS